MTSAELKEKHPDMAAELIAEGVQQGKTEMSDAIEKAKKESADAERMRIQSVKNQSMPGHEKLIETLMFDGLTTGDQAAAKVVAAEKSLRESKLKGFKADGSEIKVPVVEGSDESADKKDDTRPLEERAKAEWDKNPALRAEFTEFSAYLAYEKAQEEGRVKILKK